RVRRDPSQPNLRQVHLLHAELLDRLTGDGFAVTAGLLGENVTTRGLDLLALPTGAELHFDGGAVVEVTGLRNPCRQLDGLHPGLMRAVLARATDGSLIRLAGVMAVVRADGRLSPGTEFSVRLPAGPLRRLAPV
ncbi:MAG: MOSC domain-containing protein, partial [Jatrophihabitantaceae bacterium]